MSKSTVHCFAAIVSCLVASGCLPYAFPHLSVVPPVHLDTNQDVHAFRVDIVANIEDFSERNEFLLSPVAISPQGATPTQAGLNLDYGFYVVGIALNYPVHHGHSTWLRLYCPGHELVEVGPGVIPPTIKLTAAPTLVDQEKAVDLLISPPFFVCSAEAQWNFRREQNILVSELVQPGSASPHHREALLFAAAEYERLDKLANADVSIDVAVRDRLSMKAQKLLELASH